MACARPDAPTEATSGCIATQLCAAPGEELYRLWSRNQGERTWTPLYTRCFRDLPDQATAPSPTVTPALVLNEIRRIGLPRLEARTQPADKTLVNFDTIFYTEPEPFTTTVTLLGQRVDVTAEPTSYAWHHGDGQQTTTATPGAPYPSKEITHQYADADTAVRPRVDVTYTARFRVNGGTWQDIDETVSITGPESTLQVTEAAPVLSGAYD